MVLGIPIESVGRIKWYRCAFYFIYLFRIFSFKNNFINH